VVARTPWTLTAARSGAPSRANSSTTEPPKQKADGAKALSIDLRQGRQRGERRPAARSELGRVGTKVADECARLGKIARLPALTEHVRCQSDITEPRQALRLLHAVRVEAKPLVDDEHARPPAGCGRRVSQKSQQL